jgi:hypothetical protein
MALLLSSYFRRVTMEREVERYQVCRSGKVHLSDLLARRAVASARLFSLAALTLVASVMSGRAEPPDGPPSDRLNRPGEIYLMGLPENSRVYVNGKPAEGRQSTFTLPPGEHFFQVEILQIAPRPAPQTPTGPRPGTQTAAPTETLDKEAILLQKPTVPTTGVRVFRARVNVQAGRAEFLAVQMVPVLTTNAAYAAYIGAYGPMGPIGPPGAPADPKRRLEIAAARPLLRESLSSILSDLESQAEEVALKLFQNRELSAQSEVFWYSPTGQPASLLPALGPLGPTGTSGFAGVPGDVKRLRDEKGQLLFDRAVKSLGIMELQVTLDELRKRSALVKQPWSLDEPLASIPIYTAEVRNRLDAEYVRLATSPPMQSVAGRNTAAREGPKGRRGPDGALPPGGMDAHALIVPEAQAVQLIANMQFDTVVGERWRSVKEQVEHLARQTTTVEHLQAVRLGDSDGMVKSNVVQIEALANVTEISVSRTSGGPPCPFFDSRLVVLHPGTEIHTEEFQLFFRLVEWLKGKGFYEMKPLYHDPGASDVPSLILTVVQDGKRVSRVWNGSYRGSDADKVYSIFWEMEMMIRGVGDTMGLSRAQLKRELEHRAGETKAGN